MRLASWLLMGCVGLSAAASAAENTVGDSQKTDLEISIYNNNLALVKDRRTVDLKQGINDIAFEGVATQIKPETALLDAPGIKVLEQNYDYDLLTANNIIDKSVGQTVKTVISNPTTGQNIYDSAEIVSAVYGQPLLKFNYGIETHFPGRLVFEKLPDSLRNKPTLVAKIDSSSAASKSISLAYLTNGISWKTNYVAKVVSNNKLNLTGWVTINNESGTDYSNAKVQLIAGDVNQVSSDSGVRPMMMMAKATRAMNDYAVAESAAGAPQSLSGYHLYNLPMKTDIKDKQTKQISLLEKNDVVYKKEAYMNSPLYFNVNYTPEFRQQHPEMIYILQNKENDNLGIPLPSGIVRFYENDNDGNMQFIGENSISHVAKGEEMRLNLGSYFNIFVNGKIKKVTKLSENKTQEADNACVTVTTRYAYDAEVSFNNANTYVQEVVFEQGIANDMSVESASINGHLKDAGTYTWKVTIPAEGKQTLTFRVVAPYKKRNCGK